MKTMDRKPIYAVLSAIVVLSSGCAYRPKVAQNRVPAGNTAVSVPGTMGPAATRATVPGNTLGMLNSTRIATVPGTNTDVTGAPRVPTALGTTGRVVLMGSALNTRLQSAAALCDSLYSSAETRNWARCKALNSSLRTAANGLESLSTQNAQTALTKSLNNLNTAVASRNSAGVKKCSNQILKQLWGLSNTATAGALPSTTPMKYYGRELTMTNNLATAKSCNSAIVQCWNGVRASTANTRVQRCVNSINNCLGKNDLASAKKYCGLLLNQPSVAGTSAAMGLGV